MLGCVDTGFEAIHDCVEGDHQWVDLGATGSLLSDDDGIALRLDTGVRTAKSLFPRGHLANVMDERPERIAG